MRSYKLFTTVDNQSPVMSLEKLTHLSLIQVTGEDAKTFLQGQLTNDVNALDNSWHYSAYCTPKGRALAVFIVYAIDDQLFLLIETELVKPILKRLRMYVMRSKVAFEALDHRILGVQDVDNSHKLPFKLDPTLSQFSSQKMDNGFVLLHFGDRCLIVDTLNALDDEAEQHSAVSVEWIKKDIRDGLPRVTSQSSEVFIPQMLNMDLSNGINFKKGCYTGQEIIARMHYLGKLKQRGFVCKITNKVGVSIGEKLSNGDGKTLGNVVNAMDGTEGVFASLRFDPLPSVIRAENGAEMEILNPQPHDVDLPA